MGVFSNIFGNNSSQSSEVQVNNPLATRPRVTRIVAFILVGAIAAPTAAQAFFAASKKERDMMFIVGTEQQVNEFIAKSNPGNTVYKVEAEATQDFYVMSDEVDFATTTYFNHSRQFDNKEGKHESSAALKQRIDTLLKISMSKPLEDAKNNLMKQLNKMGISVPKETLNKHFRDSTKVSISPKGTITGYASPEGSSIAGGNTTLSAKRAENFCADFIVIMKEFAKDNNYELPEDMTQHITSQGGGAIFKDDHVRQVVTTLNNHEATKSFMLRYDLISKADMSELKKFDDALRELKNKDYHMYGILMNSMSPLRKVLVQLKLKVTMAVKLKNINLIPLQPLATNNNSGIPNMYDQRKFVEPLHAGKIDSKGRGPAIKKNRPRGEPGISQGSW